MAVVKSFGVILAVGLLIFIAVVSIGGMAVYSKQSSFCASCKVMQTRYAGWERSTHARSVHAKADCIECHSEPGVIGEFKAHINGARYVIVRLTGEGGEAILRGKVYTKACAHCHKWEEIVPNNPGHQIGHVAHMKHGLECFECHRDVAHGTLLGQANISPMETCPSCHTQQQYQMAQCSLCHSAAMINNLFLTVRHIKF